MRPSAEGAELYRRQVSTAGQELFGEFFRDLEGFSEEQLAAFTAALERLNTTLVRGSDTPEKPRLIKKV